MEDNIDKLFLEKTKEMNTISDDIKWNKEKGWENYVESYQKSRRPARNKYIIAVVALLIISTVIVLNYSKENGTNSAEDHYMQYISSIRPGGQCELQSNKLVCSNANEKCETGIYQGFKQGDSSCFNEEDNRITTGSWDLGTRHGEWIVYSVTGEVIETKNYQWGVEIN